MLQRFMAGRYGPDQLNNALIVTYLVLFVLYVLTGFDLIYAVSFVLMALTLFRMLSRNHAARRGENAWFLKKANPVIRWYRLQRTIRQDKEHRYFKCPNCRQQIRVPKNKGKIRIICPKCRKDFIRKS